MKLKKIRIYHFVVIAAIMIFTIGNVWGQTLTTKSAQEKTDAERQKKEVIQDSIKTEIRRTEIRTQSEQDDREVRPQTRKEAQDAREGARQDADRAEKTLESAKESAAAQSERDREKMEVLKEREQAEKEKLRTASQEATEKARKDEEEGKAYGKTKAETKGREFGQQRAAEARQQREAHHERLQTAIDENERKALDARNRIQKAREELEFARKQGVITEQEYRQRAERIDRADAAARELEGKVERAKESRLRQP